MINTQNCSRLFTTWKEEMSEERKEGNSGSWCGCLVCSWFSGAQYLKTFWERQRPLTWSMWHCSECQKCKISVSSAASGTVKDSSWVISWLNTSTDQVFFPLPPFFLMTRGNFCSFPKVSSLASPFAPTPPSFALPLLASLSSAFVDWISKRWH